MRNSRFLVLTGLIVLAASARLLPHLPNFTPIIAIALFGGAYLSDKRMAFIVPFLAMLASDYFLGFHNTILFVYIGFALAVGIGFYLRKKFSLLRLGGAVLGGALLFYLITNFGVWLMTGMYPMTLSGLAESYIAGIPFFQYSLLGDIFYSAVLFGAFELAKHKIPALQSVKA